MRNPVFNSFPQVPSSRGTVSCSTQAFCWYQRESISSFLRFARDLRLTSRFPEAIKSTCITCFKLVPSSEIAAPQQLSHLSNRSFRDACAQQVAVCVVGILPLAHVQHSAGLYRRSDQSLCAGFAVSCTAASLRQHTRGCEHFRHPIHLRSWRF